MFRYYINNKAITFDNIILKRKTKDSVGRDKYFLGALGTNINVTSVEKVV